MIKKGDKVRIKSKSIGKIYEYDKREIYIVSEIDRDYRAKIYGVKKVYVINGWHFLEKDLIKVDFLPDRLFEI